VEKYSEENGLDKYLVYAVIKAESNFNPNVKSNADARGLMQLMEETAVERSNVIENEDIEAYDLYDPETNIKLGTSYLSYLLELYDGNTVLAIIAYNAGLGNVKQWIKDGVIKPDGSDIENIPYKETENYVRKILRDYQMYLKIYE
jgi:soluble lytic murein transglycosylase